MTTWNWTGTQWSQLLPNNVPNPRTNVDGQLAYLVRSDPTEDGLLLLGGRSPANATMSDTWFFQTGNDWTSPSVGAPTGLQSSGGMMVDDNSHLAAVLVNGIESPPCRVPGWALTGGTSWQPYPLTAPGTCVPGFGRPVALFTAGSASVAGAATAVYPSLRQLAFNGTGWTPVVSLEDPLAWSPTYSASQGTLVIEKSGRLLWHAANGATDTTWAWSGTKWTVTAALPAISTPTAIAAQDFTVAGSGQPILFGGGTNLDSTAQWDGASWKVLLPLNTPPGRTLHAMASDPVRRRIVLYGGVGFANQPLDDTWEWDGATWQTAASGLQPLKGPAMAFDPRQNTTVLFGGRTANDTPSSETWSWSGTAWSQVVTPQSPSPRDGASLVFDPDRQVMVLHGGGNGLRDTWLFDGKNWADVTSIVGTPPASGQMAWDPVRRNLVLHTNQGPAMLMPSGGAAQRLVPSAQALRLPAGASLTRFTSTTTPAAPSRVCKVWDGRAWALSGCSSNTPAVISSVLTTGLQFEPVGTTTSVTTDYVELTVSYLMP